jgi:hypothetical protein
VGAHRPHRAWGRRHRSDPANHLSSCQLKGCATGSTRWADPRVRAGRMT